MWRSTKLVLINLSVLVVIFAGLEIYYRFFHAVPPLSAGAGFAQTFTPYTMFHGAARAHYTQWQNVWTGAPIPTDMTSNNRGFIDSHDFNWNKPYRKEANERTVIMLGGSTVEGVGASSMAMTISGRMEHYLNTRQNRFKYTVINMGGGNYIAYQEFIALELWGSAFQPDWVVIMDGSIDATIGCAESQGVMNPQFFAVMQAFINAYFSTSGVTFYRGWLENQIVKYSAAYRALTGKEYIPNTLAFDESHDANGRDQLRRSVIVPTKLGEAVDMVGFYLKAEDAMIRLYPEAGYIVSTGPSVNDFRGDFVDVYDSDDPQVHEAAMAKRSKELDKYLAAHAAEPCNVKTYPPSYTYIVGKGAFGLERLAADYRARGRHIEYKNIGVLMPNDREQRLPYFIDTNHLSDKGADLIGEFYARRILAAEASAPTGEGEARSAPVGASQ